MASVTTESTEALLASLLSALSHDARATINGISVWTHILERVSDPTAARAVDGIRRSIAQQTELAQEISDVGRDLFAVPGERPADLAALIRSLADQLGSGRIESRLPEAPVHAAMGGNALRALMRLILLDALSALSERGRIAVAIDEADNAWRVTVEIRESEFALAEANVRRPLRQTLALLAARIHDVDLEMVSGRRVLTVPRAQA